MVHDNRIIAETISIVKTSRRWLRAESGMRPGNWPTFFLDTPVIIY